MCQKIALGRPPSRQSTALFAGVIDGQHTLGGGFMHQDNPGAWVAYVVSAIIICTVLFFRFRSMRRIRKLRLERLWIVPALYALVTANVLYQSVPNGIQWLYAVIALVLGGLLGWRRGAMMRINIDPET